MYHLYAVVVHLTTTNAAYSGHYICYVKNFSGEWFRVDDSKVCSLYIFVHSKFVSFMIFHLVRVSIKP